MAQSKKKSLRYKNGKMIKKRSLKNTASYERKNNQEKFNLTKYKNGKLKESYEGSRNRSKGKKWKIIENIRKKQLTQKKSKKQVSKKKKPKTKTSQRRRKLNRKSRRTKKSK